MEEKTNFGAKKNANRQKTGLPDRQLQINLKTDNWISILHLVLNFVFASFPFL